MKLLLGFFLILSINGFAQTKESKLLKEAKQLFQQEDYKGALAKFVRESKKNESCDILLWTANCYIKLEQIEDAKREYLILLNKPCNAKENNEAIVNLGNCYHVLNQKDSAMYFYDMAIEVSHKSSPEAYFNKGLLLHDMDLFEEAKENYDKAIRLNSLNWLYYMKRQEVSFILQDFEAAIQDMLKAKDLNPGADITFNMAYAYSMMGKFQQADSIYQTIYDETDALFLNNYGFNKHKLGYDQEGIELIQKSLLLAPANSYAYRNLALIAINQNDFEKACEYLKKARELNFASNYGTEVEELLKTYCK